MNWTHDWVPGAHAVFWRIHSVLLLSKTWTHCWVALEPTASWTWAYCCWLGLGPIACWVGLEPIVRSSQLFSPSSQRLRARWMESSEVWSCSYYFPECATSIGHTGLKKLASVVSTLPWSWRWCRPVVFGLWSWIRNRQNGCGSGTKRIWIHFWRGIWWKRREMLFRCCEIGCEPVCGRFMAVLVHRLHFTPVASWLFAKGCPHQLRVCPHRCYLSASWTNAPSFSSFHPCTCAHAECRGEGEGSEGCRGS